MNHPKPEEWVPYVFGEASPEAKGQLSAHLQQCTDCRHEIDRWQQSLARLDAWKMPRPPRPVAAWTPFFRWAAATAVLLLLAGFGLGRATARTDVRQVRAALEPELRRTLVAELTQQMRGELARSADETLAAAGQQTAQSLAELTRAIENTRAEDKRVLEAALTKLDADSFAQFVTLKKQLDTVAVNAAAELRDTRQGLVQLAGYSKPNP